MVFLACQRQLAKTLIGFGTIVLAIGMAIGARTISSEAGYGGVRPNFVPWVVAGVLAVRGDKGSQGASDFSPKAFLKDALVGICIAAPVYWMFTKLLAINLPGLTSTGWS